MDNTTLAYLAGAIDSDGCITIRRCTRAVRVLQVSINPSFTERIMLKQVTPQIPELLKATFRGHLRMVKPSTPNGKPLYSWQAMNAIAAKACAALRPYLQIKCRQADLVAELRASRNGQYSTPAYWFAKENPDWATMPLVTTREAMEILGYTSTAGVAQAIGDGAILALPGRSGSVMLPRIPRPFLDIYLGYMNRARSRHGRVLPVQLVDWRTRLHAEMRELNKNGIAGTPVYHRTGHFRPL